MLRNLGIYAHAVIIVSASHAFAQQPVAAGKSLRPVIESPSVKSEPLEVKLVRTKVVLVDGKEVFQDAATARPGEILEEIATYTNKSRSTLKSLVATLPVPANTELVAGSAKPGNAMASVDGNEFATLPLKRKVRQQNGGEIDLPIPVSEYRYLRWYPGDLAAEKSLVFSARFQVANTTATVASPSVK